MKINDTVTTPNGIGRAVSTYYLPGDDPKHTPTGILVRHPKGNEIDKTKCAVAISEGETSGWLVVYKQEEVTA
jgi:hypothetical protein